MAQRWARNVVILFALYLLGVLAGQRFLRSDAPSQVSGDRDAQGPKSRTGRSTAAVEPAKPGETQDAALISAANVLRQGDGLLLAGNPDAALRQYKLLAATEHEEPSAGLRYRLAVCAESLGNLEQALTEYQQLASQSPSEPITPAARLGQVRIWCTLRRPAAAKQVLWTALLNDAGDGDLAGVLQAESAETLAQILASQAREGRETTLWRDRGITDPSSLWSPEQALQWIATREQAGAAAAPEGTPGEEAVRARKATGGESAGVTKPALEVVRQPGDGLDQMIVRAQVPEMAVAAVLELLVEKAGLPLHWSDDARETVSKRTARFRVHDRPLTNILDGVLDPRELLWEVDDRGLWIRSQEEASEESLRAFRRAIAERLLRRVIAAYPEHELTDEAHWALGNLEFDGGQPEAAALRYQQYLRKFPRSRRKSGVHFNLAKVHLLQGQRELATQQLYHVVDDGAGGEVMTAAFLYLGRLHLEDDHAPRAVKCLTRGLALAQAKSDKAATALTLAAAYLLGDNPHAANQSLMEQRRVLGVDPYSDQAAFLAALARFQAAESPAQAEIEGRALIAALTHVQPDDFFGTYGPVLVARAYRSLQMLEEAQQILLQGLDRPLQGGLRQRIRYELAQSYRRSGDREKCGEILKSLVAEGNAEWARRARLELAYVAFQSGDDAACLQACAPLLESTGAENTHREVLRLVGRVLERQKNYRDAALCFAGVAPPREALTHPQPSQSK
jgi:tetratricopeptide (TPR) repeat protein